MSDVRLVCFDWGGVIVRICRSWDEGCAAAGLEVRGDSAEQKHREKRRSLAAQYQNGDLTTDVFLDQLTESLSGLYTREEMLTIHNAWLLHEYPGIDGIVERLNDMVGIETALLSNTNALHWVRHQPGPDGSPADFPTAGALRHKIASHIECASKPSRDIYDAMDRLTGISGQEILFFDDLADNIETARAIGWRAEQIDHEGDTAAQIIRHLRTHLVF